MKSKKFKEIIPVAKAATSTYEKIMSKKSKELGLSFKEAHVLLFFYDNDNLINAKDIVFKDKVSKAFVSKAINSLVEKKYIKIMVDEKDKRYQKIILNDNAKEIINELDKVREKYRNYLIKGISNEDLVSFFNVLERIENNIMIYEERNKI